MQRQESIQRGKLYAGQLSGKVNTAALIPTRRLLLHPQAAVIIKEEK